MSAPKPVSIVLPANILGGPQKISAIAAIDLARNGHEVTIFLPILPYYYYNVVLGKRLLSWVRHVYRFAKNWALVRRFCCQELLEESGVGDRISVRFVARTASKNQLRAFDRLIVHSIAQIHEYQEKFPQERQIYLLWHPEEDIHGHKMIFRSIRTSFKGKIVVSSRFTGDEVSDHISLPALVPGPISHLIWGQRDNINLENPRRDVLLFWKDLQSGLAGGEILQMLLETRPNTTISVWCRGDGSRKLAEQALPGVDIVEASSEQELCALYLDHSMLLFPSLYEGLGVPPIEALACGCIPILHPDVGAAEMYAKDGENTVHLGESPAKIAQRIASVLEDAEALRSMRVAAPKSIDAFDPNGYSTRLLQEAGSVGKVEDSV